MSLQPILALMWGCASPVSSPPDGPASMVAIPATPGGPGAFWIDQYEFPGVAGQRPTTYTNLQMAQTACSGAGKRLCTAAEWRRACKGPDGLRYGYAAQFEPDRCHSQDLLPSGHTSMMKPDELVQPSGTFAQCKTTEGVHDMVGSVEEWVLGDWKGMDGMLEGGAWYTLAEYADCTGSYSRQPDYRLSTNKRVFSAGFRCCWTPSPPSDADIKADAANRLSAAQLSSSIEEYDPNNEVQIGPELFMDRYEHPNRAGEVPTVGWSWKKAAQACDSAGKRLCSAKEWEDACAGSARTRWPYGDRPVPEACATLQDSVKPSGAHIACITPTGINDLVGNVWEWTQTAIDAPVLAPPAGGPLYEIRGGSYGTDDTKATCLPSDGYPLAPGDAVFPDVGFRCCRGEAPTPPLSPSTSDLLCPTGMRSVDDFCIDQHEYPNRQFHAVTGNLNWAEANEACTSSGKHVCTEREWTHACAGSEHRRWPYGDTYQRGACRDSSATAIDEGGGAARAGEQVGCHTPEGVRDMSGNLWEWVATESAASGAAGVIRGGGWNISAGLGQCRAVFEPSPDYEAPEVGTRCCATAAEAGALLAAQQ